MLYAEITLNTDICLKFPTFTYEIPENLNSIKEPIWTEQQLPKNSQDEDEEIKTKIVGELDGKLSEHILININWISISKEVQKIYTEKYGE